jgi:FixJ family two-component response regulator
LQPFNPGRSPYRPFNRRHLAKEPLAAFKQLKNSDIEVQKECSGESVNAIRTQSARMRGRLNKQIGADLGIAEKTVKVHRGRVMEKMQASSLAELVHMCDIIGIELPPHPR